MQVTMLRKITTIFGVSGFSIAILLSLVWTYLNGHTSVNPANAPLFSDVTDWLWPTNIMLMAVHGNDPLSSVLALTMSALVNGAIYGIVGLIVGGLVKLFRD